MIFLLSLITLSIQLSTDQIYFTTANEYVEIKNSFKHVILQVYEKDYDKELLTQVIQKYHNKLDIIVMVGQQEDFSKNKPGFYLKKYEQTTFIDPSRISLDLIDKIIYPNMTIITQQQAEEMYQNNKTFLLLVMNETYKFRDQVKLNIEKILFEGLHHEIGIPSIYLLEESSFLNQTSPAMILFNQVLGEFDDRFKVYDNNLTYYDQIVDFLTIESLPLVTPLEEKYYSRIFGSNLLKTQIHLILKDNSTKNNNVIEQIRIAAVQNKIGELKADRILFTASPYPVNTEIWEQFDINANSSFPMVVATHMNFRKYQMEKYFCCSENITTEKINNFIDQLKNHTLKQYLRSETPLQDQTGIIKIVGKSFSKDVLTSKTAVFVLFWDSKTPELTVDFFAIIEALFSQMDDEQKSQLTIGIYDMALNEHPWVNIKKVPALGLFVAPEKKKPKMYDMTLTLEQIQKWLNYYIPNLDLGVNKSEKPILGLSPGFIGEL